MNHFENYSKKELEQLYAEVSQKLKKYQGMGLDLNMARGKPCKEQLDISDGLVNGDIDFSIGIDYRNYGLVDGIPEAKALFKDVIKVKEEELIIGGNSSLNMMYDAISKAMLLGTVDSVQPWSKEKKIKFICPVPGYDRHFAICEALGIEMINVEMDENGPLMDQVEELVKSDVSIKGMWCMPMYSNPTGISYSDEVVDRLAKMKTAACDFRIFWDNAYAIHHLSELQDNVKDIMDVAKAVGHENRIYMFTSTSKITYPGAGVAMMGASKANADFLRKQINVQTIGPDKVNQLLHVKFLKDYDNIMAHMEKHAEIISPKFDIALKILDDQLKGSGFANWNVPKGGYFISLDVMDHCAKEIVALCETCGVTLTPAGATFPYGKDPKDSNIRIAPTFPPVSELEVAIDILCTCVKYVCLERLSSD